MRKHLVRNLETQVWNTHNNIITCKGAWKFLKALTETTLLAPCSLKSQALSYLVPIVVLWQVTTLLHRVQGHPH